MRKVSLVPIPALLVLVGMGCQPPAQQEAPLARTDEQVRADVDALRASWQTMANADDVAGVAASYTEDATFVDQYGGVHEGRAAITAYLEQSLARESGAYDIRTTGTVAHGDMVAAWGTWAGALTGPAGPVPVSGMWQTVGLYQPDGSLKLRLHMAMTPATPPAM